MLLLPRTWPAIGPARDPQGPDLRSLRDAGIKPDSVGRAQPPHGYQTTEFSRLFRMSRVCEITGKRPAVGNRVSHANNKKRRRFLPNLHSQRFWVEGEKRWVSLRISSNGLRTIDKNGIDKIVAELRTQGMKI